CRDSRKSATTSIGAGWCFHYTKARASRQPGITSLEAGSCFNYYTASFCSGTRGTKLIKQYVQEAQARVVMG
ncbi:hypothetical protein PF010_g31347, partial [Phytophthora fragariae]